jgi:hypothetical protein
MSGAVVEMDRVQGREEYLGRIEAMDLPAESDTFWG